QIMGDVQVLYITEQPITVSMGICYFNGSDPPNNINTLIDALIGRADKALYTAKQQGRNQFVQCSLHTTEAEEKIKQTMGLL
ncbi:diguanylate cyclase domain-containing protein, partial [Photobacterium sp. OFAV2-7]|uniref:GGDEF domain-containing protein n=1 Tax=Photobacterium sp. OFAV2-7 TaxID=2917748 RepID=UPI001EF5C432